MNSVVPHRLVLPTAADTDAFGRRLGALLRAGDLILLAGDLGAGKTALTKGIAVGMGVHGLITSPTFVIARVHRSAAGGPSLVHVDAYRLGGRLELDDLDLDTDLDRAAVVVEWGTGVAEQLSDSHLRIELTRQPDDTRIASVQAVGEAWTDRLRELVVGDMAGDDVNDNDSDVVGGDSPGSGD